MKKIIYIFTVSGLMLLLAACGATGTTTGQNEVVTATSTVSLPDTPTSEPEPPMAEETMATEEPMVTEEATATEEPVIKEPTATTEIMPTEEIMAEQVDMPRPTEAQQQLLASLPIIGTPPELNNEVWLNSDPLKLANLQGQVVIVEFWTYG